MLHQLPILLGQTQLPDPLTQRTPLDFTFKVPIHIAFNEKREVNIIEGHAPYGISTEKRITKKILQHHKPTKPRANPIKTALRYQNVYQSLPSPSMAKTAEVLGVSRVRVHQMLSLLKLDKRIIDYLLKDNTDLNFSERRLRGLLNLPTDQQFDAVLNLNNS